MKSEHTGSGHIGPALLAMARSLDVILSMIICHIDPSLIARETELQGGELAQEGRSYMVDCLSGAKSCFLSSRPHGFL